MKMRFLKKPLLVMLLLPVAWSCDKKEKADYAILSGQLSGKKLPEQIQLLKGRDVRFEVKLDDSGNFADTLYIDTPGYYVMKINDNRIPVYIAQGDNLEMKADLEPDDFYETLSVRGDGAENIRYLLRRDSIQRSQNKDQEAFYLLEEDVFKKTVKHQQKIMDSLVAASGLSEDFAALEKKGNFYNYAGYLQRYPMYHKYYAKKDSLSLSEDFDAELSDIDYENEEDYNHIPSYASLVFNRFNERVGDAYKKMKEEGGEEGRDLYMRASREVMDTYPKGRLKDDIIANHIYYLSPSTDDPEELYNYLLAGTTYPDTREKINEKYDKIKTLVKGKPSPVFEGYENYDGGTTSLADLKGKYVYIDVWATWCGPCKAEIPHLQKVEEDYKNKNIHFLSVSIDREKDRDAWKTMIAEKDMGGIQVLADNAFNSKFVQDYGIEGIPTFILIDPEGNIVSADAPRPSDKNLRKLFDELL